MKFFAKIASGLQPSTTLQKFYKVLNMPLYFSILQTQVLIFLKLNTSIPAQMIFYLDIKLSIVKESIMKCKPICNK